MEIGYPKLDAYLLPYNSENNYWKDNNKIKIIYAPHHSFEKSELNIATFKKNGEYILDLAKKYCDKTTWIFKPHPRFKYALLKNKIMNEDEIQNYYQEWKKIGNVYESGNYFDIFKTSNLMITDCASFLGEYLPTLKPLIRLVNEQGLNLNSIGKLITQGYYQVDNNVSLEKTLVDLISNNTDPYLPKRKEANNIFFNNKTSSSEKIFNTLLKICKIGDK